MKRTMLALIVFLPLICYTYMGRVRDSYIFYKTENEEIVGYKISVGDFNKGQFKSITYYIYKDCYIKVVEIKKMSDYTKEMRYTIKERLKRFFISMLRIIFLDIIDQPTNLGLNLELYIGNKKNNCFFYVYFDENKKNFQVRHYGKIFRIKELFKIIAQKFDSQEMKMVLNMVYNDNNLLGQLAFRYSVYKNQKFLVKGKYIPCEKAEGKFGFDCNLWEKAKIIDNMAIVNETNETK